MSDFLEYQRFEPNRITSAWNRRYLRCAPLFGLAYFALYACFIFAAFHYMDVPEHSVPKWLSWTSAVLEFPALTFIDEDKVKKGLPILLIIINAEIWGLAVVAIWHAASAMCRRSRVPLSR
jgi:hypothetical protein